MAALRTGPRDCYRTARSACSRAALGLSSHARGTARRSHNRNMPVSADALRSHLDYTAWASGLLLEAAGQLSSEELNRDFGTGDKSVAGTLVHIFAGDRIWLERMNGISRENLLDPGDRDFEKLQRAWPEIHQGWRTWAS